MVFFGEQKAGILEPGAIKAICVLENLTNGVDCDVLGKDVFTLFLDGLDIVFVGELIKRERVMP